MPPHAAVITFGFPSRSYVPTTQTGVGRQASLRRRISSYVYSLKPFLSDLRGEKQGKRHVAYLVLQLLDPVDMRVLVLENVFQYLRVAKSLTSPASLIA